MRNDQEVGLVVPRSIGHSEIVEKREQKEHPECC